MNSSIEFLLLCESKIGKWGEKMFEGEEVEVENFPIKSFYFIFFKSKIFSKLNRKKYVNIWATSSSLFPLLILLLEQQKK